MLVVLMLLNWLLFPSLLSRQVTEVGYDELVSMMDSGKVQTVSYDSQDHEIIFEAQNDKGQTAIYKTGIFPDDDLVNRLLSANVKFAAEIPTQASPLVSMLVSYAIPIVLIIVVGNWLQKKMMKNIYDTDDAFFKEIDSSIRKNCHKLQDVNVYLIQFQNFTQDLMMLMGNLMKFKLRLPSFMKNSLYKLTAKTVEDIFTKNDFSDASVLKTVLQLRQFNKRLAFSQQWVTDFTFQVLMLAKKEPRPSDEDVEKAKQKMGK